MLALLVVFLVPVAIAQSAPAANLTFSAFDGSSFLTPLGINHTTGIVGTYCCAVLPSDSDGSATLGFVLNSRRTFGKFVFMPLLPFNSSANSYAKGINASNVAVGGFQDVNQPQLSHGFRLLLDHIDGLSVFMQIDFPGAGGRTDINGISSVGEMVGGYCQALFCQSGALDDHGFKRDAAGNFSTIDFPGAKATVVNGINKAGDMVGNFLSENHIGGWLLSGGTFTTIMPPGAYFSGVSGINNSGVIVGTFGDSHGTHGFMYVGGVYSTIDHPKAGGVTTTDGIDDEGEIVGSYQRADSQTFGYIAK